MENVNSLRNFGIITTNKNIVDGQKCQRIDKIYQKVIDIDAKVDSLRYELLIAKAADSAITDKDQFVNDAHLKCETNIISSSSPISGDVRNKINQILSYADVLSGTHPSYAAVVSNKAVIRPLLKLSASNGK